MKILVGFPTRGRPLGAATVLGVLSTFESGQNDVSYAVRCDDDDPMTFSVLSGLRRGLPRLDLDLKPRPMTLGSTWNDLAKGRDWDAFVHFVDDFVPACVGWDATIAETLKTRPVVAWNLLDDPGHEGVFAVSRAWYDALGYVEPERFPFWFGDTWVSEVHRFATGRRIPIAQDLVLSAGGKRAATIGMREVAFWFRYFAATRSERFADAERIANSLGRTADRSSWADMLAWDRRQAANAAAYERSFIGDEPPNPRYDAVRARAADYLATHDPQN